MSNERLEAEAMHNVAFTQAEHHRRVMRARSVPLVRIAIWPPSFPIKVAI